MPLKAIELFAGVGGFRLGLEAAGHQVVWSNQWEPGKRSQHASDCYARHFPQGTHVCDDIGKVDPATIPDHDLIVGGFPCQDYSVATTNAKGIEGKKGVLWWEIERIARATTPSYLLLENVDRLLRSPTKQRGRDFGIVLRGLADLGYRVEWRAINAADYGFPQKRRRTFIFAAHESTSWGQHMAEHAGYPSYFAREGFFSQPFPVREEAVLLADEQLEANVDLPDDVQTTSDSYSMHFRNAGVMVDGIGWTFPQAPMPGELRPLRSILQRDVHERYFVPEADVPKWKYLKGAKAEKRMTDEGFEYRYAEGAIPFPEDIDQPSRTLLTGEGGTSPSRFKHLIKDPQTGRFRVLTPLECERLNGFPDGWTEGMPERWRYFCMGNALVVGLVEQMARRLAEPVTPRAAPKKVRAAGKAPAPSPR